MKKLILTLCVGLGVCVFGGINLSVTQRIQFAWNYSEQVDAFKFYVTTNQTLPTTNWQVISTISGTNRMVILNMLPQHYFCYVTATNIWGESDPSNVVELPSPVSTNLNLFVEKKI